MSSADLPSTLDALLAQRQWVRDLSRRLVRDESAAADLEQRTWLRALCSPPRDATRPRAWLGTVLRNLVREEHRSTTRRARRERAAARGEALRPTVEVVAEAELHGQVVRAALALPEPFRATLILRFFEGLGPTAIAEREHIPIETVRSRLRRGVGRLRQTMQAERGGEWCAALLPLAAQGRDMAIQGTGHLGGALAMGTATTTKKTAVLMALVLLALAIPTGLVLLTGGSAGTEEPASAATTAALTEPLASAVGSKEQSGRTGTTVDAPGIPERGRQRVRVRPRRDAAGGSTSTASPDSGGGAGLDEAGRATNATTSERDSTTSSGLATDRRVADWDARLARARALTASRHDDLGMWSLKNGLARSALVVRHRGLLFDPDHEKLRKRLGYTRDDAGWVRSAAWLDQARAERDGEGPATTKFAQRYDKVIAKAARLFSTLARSAAANADPVTGTLRQLWASRARTAWSLTLDCDPHARVAHHALGHTKFGKDLVSPLRRRFLESRAQRAERVRKVLDVHASASGTSDAGLRGDRGLSGFGVRTRHFLVTADDRETADALARVAERALAYASAELGLDAKRVQKFFRLGEWHATGDAGIYAQLGGGSGDLPDPPIAQRIDAVRWVAYALDAASASELFAREIGIVLTRSWRDKGRGKGRLRGVDDWLPLAIGHDTAYAILGTHQTPSVPLGNHAALRVPVGGEDPWIGLARELVILDDAVPLRDLPRLRLDEDEIDGRALVQGYAFLRFLVLDDPKAAAKFVEAALSKGSSDAARSVYRVASLGDLEERYREWLLREW